MESSHTNNWAVIVSTSRFWFNYRHPANTLSIYHIVKRLGIPDSHIILMMADDVACNPRNKEPGSVFNHYDRKVDVYGDNVEVDYRGIEVNVESFIRLLTGRHEEKMPRSKRLMTDSKSNILLYLTGHGGDGFLKFQDTEEITSFDLADAFQQMWEKSRYNSMLFISDTCQAKSLSDKIYSPNIISIASSLIGESSYSHHVDRILGVPVIDRFTNHMLSFFESMDINSPLTLQDFVDSWKDVNVLSTPSIVSTHTQGHPYQMKLVDFFGHVQKAHICNSKCILYETSNGTTFAPPFIAEASFHDDDHHHHHHNGNDIKDKSASPKTTPSRNYIIRMEVPEWKDGAYYKPDYSVCGFSLTDFVPLLLLLLILYVMYYMRKKRKYE